MNKFISNKSLKNIAIIVLIAIFFIADRYLKMLAISQPLGFSHKLIGNFFSFSFTPNYYMAFSLPFGGLILNSIIIAIILCLISIIFYLILNKKRQVASALLLTFILFGAISNILDRLLYGYVVDYLEVKGLTVFNVADAMITLGVIFFLTNSNTHQNSKP